MKMFTVIEYTSHYQVRHNPSGQVAFLSDGVDCLFTETGRAIRPGREYFRRKWENSLNENEDETLEAYFPEEVKP